ncbi:hypothetical protein BCR44DRAFT_39156, partial [Catenaria anguillulae PL171]
MFTRLVATRSAAARPASLVAPTVTRVAAVRCYSDDAGAIRSAKGSLPSARPPRRSNTSARRAPRNSSTLLRRRPRRAMPPRSPLRLPRRT